ncbi:hypothetical protein BZA77DRAFT_353760 [Pyronema omphalodes]|nr:hypothetical protein BZA77DRAFT_353760 [Pyronema omphalodes]
MAPATAHKIAMNNNTAVTISKAGMVHDITPNSVGNTESNKIQEPLSTATLSNASDYPHYAIDVWLSPARKDDAVSCYRG